MREFWYMKCKSYTASLYKPTKRNSPCTSWPLIVSLSIVFTSSISATAESYPYCTNLLQYVCTNSEPILIPTIEEKIEDFGWRETLARIENNTVMKSEISWNEIQNIFEKVRVYLISAVKSNNIESEIRTAMIRKIESVNLLRPLEYATDDNHIDSLRSMCGESGENPNLFYTKSENTIAVVSMTLRSLLRSEYFHEGKPTKVCLLTFKACDLG